MLMGGPIYRDAKGVVIRLHSVDKEKDLESLVGNAVSTAHGSAKYKGKIEQDHVFLYRVNASTIGFGSVRIGKIVFSPQGQIQFTYLESFSKASEPLLYAVLDAELQEVRQ